jgi:hypothetical protein
VVDVAVDEEVLAEVDVVATAEDMVGHKEEDTVVAEAAMVASLSHHAEEGESQLAVCNRGTLLTDGQLPWWIPWSRSWLQPILRVPCFSTEFYARREPIRTICEWAIFCDPS